MRQAFRDPYLKLSSAGESVAGCRAAPPASFTCQPELPVLLAPSGSQVLTGANKQKCCCCNGPWPLRGSATLQRSGTGCVCIGGLWPGPAPVCITKMCDMLITLPAPVSSSVKDEEGRMTETMFFNILYLVICNSLPWGFQALHRCLRNTRSPSLEGQCCDRLPWVKSASLCLALKGTQQRLILLNLSKISWFI